MEKTKKFNKKKSLKKNKLHNKLHIKHTIRKNKLKYNKMRKTLKGGNNNLWKSNTIKLEKAFNNIKIEPSFELAKNSIKNASKSGEDTVRHISESAMHLKNHISKSFNKYFNISYN